MRDSGFETASRRSILKTGLKSGAALLLGGVAATAAHAQDAQKLPQAAVQYQEMPKDGQKCSDCVNFVAPNACKIVAGDINPNGWCVAFAPKNG